MPFDIVTCDLHGPGCSVGVRVLPPTLGDKMWNLLVQNYSGQDYSYIGLTTHNIDALVAQLLVARAAMTV